MRRNQQRPCFKGCDRLRRYGSRTFLCVSLRFWCRGPTKNSQTHHTGLLAPHVPSQGHELSHRRRILAPIESSTLPLREPA